MADYTIENVVDVAWKTDGLHRVMRERGDKRVVVLEHAQARALLLRSDIPSLSQNDLNNLYQAMEGLAEEYGYDSGIRKYNSI